MITKFELDLLISMVKHQDFWSKEDIVKAIEELKEKIK